MLRLDERGGVPIQAGPAAGRTSRDPRRGAARGLVPAVREGKGPVRAPAAVERR